MQLWFPLLAANAAVAAKLRGRNEAPVHLHGAAIERGRQQRTEIAPGGFELAVRLDGWAEPVYAGEASAELLAALAEQD